MATSHIYPNTTGQSYTLSAITHTSLLVNIANSTAPTDIFETTTGNGFSNLNASGSIPNTTTIIGAAPYSQSVENLAYFSTRIYLPLILIFGVCGNLMTITVMSGKEFQTLTTRITLLALAVSDTLLLITQPFNKLAVIGLFGRDIRALSRTGCKTFFIMFKLGKMTSSWFIVLICLERFVAVWFPLKVKLICVRKLVISNVIAAYLVMIIYNGLWQFSSDIVDGKCVPGYTTEETQDMYTGFLLAGSCLYSLVPISILLVFSPITVIKLLIEEKKRKKFMTVGNRASSELKKITTMLLLVAFAYTILVAPITSMHIYSNFIGVDIFTYNHTSFQFYREFAQMLEQLNYAINFWLYIMVSDKFRNRVRAILCCAALVTKKSKRDPKKISSPEPGV